MLTKIRLAYLTSILVLTGCIEDTSDSETDVVIGNVPCGPEHAVSYRANQEVENYTLAALGTAYGDGSHVDLIKDGAFVNQNLYPSTQTDYILSAHGSYYYHIGRKGIDTIQKYYRSQPNSGLFLTENGLGYSLRESGSEVSSNAHALAFINESTAIMPMYELNKAWVVNTNAQVAEEFKICELDLSAYASENTADESTGEVTKNPPRMSRVFVNSQYAVITMQRLYDGWTPGTAFAAVFNLNDWSEVDTNPNEDGLMGIQLNLKNHQDGDLSKDGNTIYLASLVYADKSGGIEKIDLTNLTSSTVNTDFGYSAVESTENGNLYAVSYEKWQSNTLYEINSGSLVNVESEFESTYLTVLEAHGNDLWVGKGEDLKLIKVNAETNTKASEIAVSRPVSNIAFIED